MHFESLADFLKMGGYAPFVWSVYGLTFLIFVVLYIAPIVAKKSLIDKIKDLKLREES